MSLDSYFLGSECGVDIYEEPDMDTWVKCVKSRNTYHMVILAVILLVILLVVFFTGGPTSGFYWGALGGALLVGAGFLYGYTILPVAAANEWKATQKELRVRVDAGMSKQEAIKEIQKEKLEKAKIQAMENQARAIRESAYRPRR